MEYISKEQAFEALSNGRAIAHYHFEDNEYIEPMQLKNGTFQKDVFKLSGMYVVNKDQFFALRKTESWNSGWFVIDCEKEITGVQEMFHVPMEWNNDKSKNDFYFYAIGLRKEKIVDSFISDIKINFETSEMKIQTTRRIIGAKKIHPFMFSLLYNHLEKCGFDASFYPINKTLNTKQ